ncbi:DNA polymerase IV [Thiohalorhabdus methylotrophus]|uniref:DNA polymerase IV n=1 Tax=Thiohalorhabdus methylotrophus TaxID=3242694 RepID=A0ABV4TSU6_9GAMM
MEIRDTGQRRILHCDMDSFFAAVHMRDEPHLREVPLVIGGDPDGRGVVSTANYAAREYGIHSAQPAATAKRLCPHAVFLRPELERYRRESRRIMDIFRDFTEIVEPASLDEAYLEVTGRLGPYGSATAVAEAIRARVREETGLTVSIGVSNSRLVAKIASDWDKPDGLTVVRPARVPEFLAPLPVRKLHGVGPATGEVLSGMGITTVDDLRARSREELAGALGQFGVTLHDFSRGIDPRPVGIPRERKSLGVEDTFQRDIGDLAEMDRRLTAMAGHVAEQLSAKELRGRTITAKVRFPDFRTLTRSQTLERPSQDPEEIAFWACQLLRRTEAGHRPVRLLGVTVSNLEDNAGAPEQFSLFGSQNGL